MKKIVLITMAILFVLTFAACGNETGEKTPPSDNPAPSATPAPTPEPTPTPTPEPTPNPELSLSLEEIIKKMHEAMPSEITDHLVFQEISDDMKNYFLGTEEIEFTEALAAEPMIGVMPHSIVVFRVEEGTDVDAVVKLVKENADPRKWICVGVEPDQLLVESIGHTIALVIDENSEAIMEIFRNLQS
jgi:hypothetical protein